EYGYSNTCGYSAISANLASLPFPMLNKIFYNANVILFNGFDNKTDNRKILKPNKNTIKADN
ncbi:hypothetical protein, partial [Bacteroides sp.]|uniref:hypothetical protein n=1 Tax=Bacteroides sp. TaxID=29523 RepID=UPI00258E652F